jgi:hypothetical protein
MKTRTWAFLGIFGVALVTLSITATAQIEPFHETKDAEGYRVVFPDDPLRGGGFDGHDALIPIVKHGMRVTLIRPRTQFVDELVKSVEKI